MPNWLTGRLRIRGPFNRIVDFVWNGLDLTQIKTPDFKTNFVDTLVNCESSDPRSMLLSEAFYRGDGWIHIKGTHRNFVIPSACYVVGFDRVDMYPEPLKDLYTSKLGINTPRLVNPVQKIKNGSPHINIVYKYSDNSDVIAEFEIACAWDVDANIVNSAVRFGIDIKIEGVEPGLQFYRTCEFTRFGETKVFDYGSLDTSDDVWNCPYPIPDFF